MGIGEEAELDCPAGNDEYAKLCGVSLVSRGCNDVHLILAHRGGAVCSDEDPRHICVGLLWQAFGYAGRIHVYCGRVWKAWCDCCCEVDCATESGVGDQGDVGVAGGGIHDQ